MGLSRLLPRPNTRSSSTEKGSSLARVIAFANQKGGVAKTTTTLNLGVALKEKGHSVLVVDLDPQGNLTMSQGWNPDEIEPSLWHFLVHNPRMGETPGGGGGAAPVARTPPPGPGPAPWGLTARG